MKLKVRFLAGGAIVFLLGLILTEVRGFQLQEVILMAVGIVILVAGLFWKDKPPRKPDAQGAT